MTGDRKKDWKFVHHLIWLESGREISPEHFIYFKDRNPRNLTLDNLGIATKQERNERIAAIHKSLPSKIRRPLGYEIINNEGYIIRKVSNTGVFKKDWQLAHRYVWQEAGREIPPGHVVVFKDGNRKNVSLENLELMPRVEFARQTALLKRAENERFGFKKGRTSFNVNKLPIGSERRRKTGLLMRKVRDTGDSSQDWCFVHHLLWREAGREVPPGYFLCFKDGDCTNVKLENLEVVSKSEFRKRMWNKKKNEKVDHPE